MDLKREYEVMQELLRAAREGARVLWTPEGRALSRHLYTANEEALERWTQAVSAMIGREVAAYGSVVA